MNVRHANIRRRSTSFSVRISKDRTRMKGFRPEEILFSPTTDCNLSCGHCGITPARKKLSVKDAGRFLLQCSKLGVKRIGFTGGEPFLALDFLCALTRKAVGKGLLFDRIMTNAVWWTSEDELKSAFGRLHNAGYDGSICVSVDAFHAQSIVKVARFIELAARIWRRPDMVSIAYTHGAKGPETKRKLRALFALVKKIPGEIFIRTHKIAFAPIGNALKFKVPWDGRWFREDYCQGPGNVFLVAPDGDVRPCCGYATPRRELSIGNIKTDSAAAIMKNLKKNKFVHAIFNRGLNGIRIRLEKSGVRFPGKIGSHCYFCDYILTKVPRKILAGCLMMILALSTLIPGRVLAWDIKAGEECPEIRSSLVKKVAIPKWYHEGLFYDGKSLWLANGEKGNIWVIDTTTGSVISRIEPLGDFSEALIRADNGSLFTTEWYTRKVYRVKIEGGRLISKKESSLDPAHPAGIASSGKRLFLITWTRGLGTKFHLVEMDMDLKVVSTMLIRDIQEPCQLAWDGKDLWISSWYTKKIYRVDIDRWEITGYIRSPVSKTTGIAWDGEYMWVTGTYSDLYQMKIGK